MAFSPLTGQVLAADNAETPAYGNLFSTTNGHAPATLTVSPITVPPTCGGDPGRRHGAATWNPTTERSWFPFGVGRDRVARCSRDHCRHGPANDRFRKPEHFIVLADRSSPWWGRRFVVGCGNVGTQAVLLNKNGLLMRRSPASVVRMSCGTTRRQKSSTSPVIMSLFPDTTRFFDVVNEDGTIAGPYNLPATADAHSITVNPFNGDVFVPLAGARAEARVLRIRAASRI